MCLPALPLLSLTLAQHPYPPPHNLQLLLTWEDSNRAAVGEVSSYGRKGAVGGQRKKSLTFKKK